MTSREVKKDKMGDDPPYLAVGTDVSAKYKGAFCEAKVRKVVRVVKCKVHMKNGGVAFVTDDQIKGNLRIGTPVEVKLPDKKDYAEANITSIKDLSQYTVVFDDGDITTLRRTALCLKSGRHFAESETLDQLPLTHPEHFSTPVIGASRRGRRRLGGNEDSSDEEGSSVGGGGGGGERQREADIGKVVCVEISEKKKVKDNWFPGLIVAPNAQDAVRIHVDEDYLVRSFKDGRYFTVPKKEATEFTREIGLKVDSPSLKQAVEKALVFLDKDELPPHWDRELLFGLVDSDLEDDDDALDSDSSDDEPREEKDHFVAQLYKFMDDRGTPINKGPVIQSRDVDLYRLFRVVHKLGGYNRVTNQNQWKLVTHKMSFGTGANTVNSVKHAYKKFLHSFEDFYRKLGCTMVNHPRSHRRPNSKSNRSLIRDRDRATPHTKEPNPGGPASSGEPSASRDPVEVKVEVKREEADDSNESRTSKKDSSVSRVSVSRDTSVSRVSVSRDKPPGGFEAKRDRHVKEEAQRRERTRDKTYKESGKDSKDIKDVKDVQDSKEESIAPPAKKRVEENLKLKVDERPPKSSIGILAKFSYRKEKPGQTRGNEEKEKDRMNRVKKSLGKGSGLMERQKRTIKDTVKALAKTLGFGGKASGASVSGNVAAVNTASSVASTRKVCAVTTASGSGEDEDRKKPKEEVAVVPSVEKRASSGTRSATTREDTAAVSVAMTSSHPPQPSTPPVPPPARKSSLSGEDRRSRSSRSRRPEDEGSMEPASVSSNPGETSDGLTLDIVSPHKWISVGDKLRVYYGPNHKSKVTYEAKVVATRQEGEAGEREYLVHYTGWNTRYDEWIRRNRIAENLAWNTTTSQQQQNKESCSPGISSSSRNKSTPRRSSTRTSARNTRPNTDDSESDKESEGGSESETEIEANSSSQNRSMRSRRILSDDEKKPAVPSPGTKTRSNRKCKTDEEEEEGEKLKEKQEEEEDKKKLPLPEAERKSLRLSQRKKQEVEHEKRLGPESDSGSDSESQEDSKAKVLEIIEPLDDVYEFKEPEPFTFSKQKKTISPPGPSGQKGKKNIGLFEDYDNLDEENEDIHVAIQRVMDTCDENQMDLDLLDSNSSDSNSSDSNSMCEMMKKRLQSEINTYEGPKSKLKGRGEESIPPMRTRRSSESKSSKMSGEEKGKLPVVRPKEEKVLDETQVEKPNEQMKNETDSVLAATRSKKSEVESSTPKSKRSEAESAASKVKKPDTNPAAGNKSKKAGELESVPSPKGKKPLDTDTIILKAKKSESENITTPKTKKSDVDTNIVACPKLKKSDLDTEVSPKFKKSDSDNSIVTSNKAKKSELDVSNKTKKSDIITITSSKAKKILDWETVSGPKAKKSEVDINESTSPGKTNKKIETPETNMKTRLKTESRCSSPGSKTRSKSELTSSKTDLTPRKTEPTQKEEVPIIPETNMADNKQSTSPLPSAKQEKAKPPVLENRTRVSSPSKKPSLEVKLHNISKSAELVKPLVSLATKVSDNVEATILAVSSLITPALPATLQSKPICHSEPQDSTEGFTKLSLVLEAKKQDLLFLGSKMTPKAKPKVIPSFSPQRSHTDFSAQTEPLEIDKDRNILTSSSLPKLPDIPVLQRIESVVLKTPIKREPIDPTKIDLIKVSPNMPQLEKIDTMDVIETATPVKKEETTVQREDLKFPPFQFEDVLETPEKIFLPAVDTESEDNVRPDTIAKPDKKIEFKMKPKAVSPCGFSKTERARKLVRQRLDEAESPTKTVSSKEKKPSQTSPQVKKYGPACKPDSSNVSSTDAVNTNIKTKVQSDVESKDNRPPVPIKLKETSPLLVGKTKELPAIVSPKVKETSPGSSKVKDSPTCVSSKFKESSPIRSNKNKDTTTAVSTKKDSTLSPPKRTRDISSCLSDKIKDCSSSPVPIKSKDGSVIILSKGKDTPAVLPDKNKDTLLTVIKSKESTPTSANKIRASTPVLLSKEKESDLQQPNKPRDAIIVSSSSKESMDGEFTIEIDTKSEDAKSSPPTGKQVVDVKNIEEVEIKCEPETSLDINKEGNKKQKEESKLSNAPESNIKVEESTELVRNESEDPHTSKEVEQSKTPEKEKDVEKGKSKEDIDEDAVKREEKSKELSSVFEFDETLEDEIVDLESESYLASSKRKLAALIDSPGSEFMSNKLAKLNELEKLKQKLFMDCSGEGEDLEEKADGEKKEEGEGKPDTALLELTADETLEEEVDNTLLCKETIPGSPTPYQDELNMIMELPPTNSSSGPGSSSSSTASHSANAVLDNTPPTTPESSLSPPRNECTGVSGGSGVYAKIVLGGDEREGGGTESPKKTLSSTPMKRRSSQTERSLKKRLKQSPRNTGPGSDSDDLSISEPFSIFSPTSTDITKSKYSYFVELDPELDQAQRIAVVQQKLQDLRKEYLMYKQELVTIDRRRKKIRRRERENKKNNVSAPPAALPSV